MPSWWWSGRERWEVWGVGGWREKREEGGNRKTDRKSSREGKTARYTDRQTGRERGTNKNRR